MTIDEKKEMVNALYGEPIENSKLTAYLTAAEKEIIAWRFSYSAKIDTVIVVPSEYEMTQVYAVIAGFSQSGAENQTSHTENGISRSFKYADMIAYIRAHVIPYAGVM